MIRAIYFLLTYFFFVSMAQALVIANSRTTFQGMITVATCNVVVGDDNQVVEMGEISTAELDARGRSTPVHFTINLYGCSSADKIVRTMFDRSGRGASGSIITVNGVNGVGLALQDGAGNPINFNQYSNGQKIQAGDNALLYSAHLVKTGTIQPGNFSRLLHYTLSYE